MVTPRLSSARLTNYASIRVLYWLPMARWVVHENNARVLSHLRRHAEQNMRVAR